MVNLLKNNSLINSVFRTESDIDWSKNCKKRRDACFGMSHPKGELTLKIWEFFPLIFCTLFDHSKKCEEKNFSVPLHPN